MRKLWGRISLIAAVTFAITVVAIHEEPHHHMWRYVFWPGFVMAVDWLYIDYCDHPVAAFCLGMTFNMSQGTSLLVPEIDSPGI